MKKCLLPSLVFLGFFFGTSLPISMILIGAGPLDIQEKIKTRHSQLTQEEVRIWREYSEKFRVYSGTIPFLTLPTALLLTFLTFKKKSSGGRSLN